MKPHFRQLSLNDDAYLACGKFCVIHQHYDEYLRRKIIKIIISLVKLLKLR